jgi:hypothetical protein
MPRFPLKERQYARFNGRGDARTLMSNTNESELIFSPHSLEILSVVSGAHLTPTQRRSLLPVLHELLADSSLSPFGSGPLSQADVLGACIGLAMFAINHRKQRWSFMHIPGGRVRSPDIYAVSSDNDVWHVELKAVAPLDSEIATQRRLDTCRRVAAQRTRALAQLNSAGAPWRVGPTIKVAGGSAAPARISTHGRAFVITVLPAAGLAARRDILSPEKRGCPISNGRYQPCSEACLNGSFVPGFATSIATLMGEETFDPVPGPLPPPSAILGVLRLVNGAIWSGSTHLANKALSKLGASLRELEKDERESLAGVAMSCLKSTRSLSSRRTREPVAAILAETAEDREAPWREAERSGNVEPEPLEIATSDLLNPTFGRAQRLSRQVRTSAGQAMLFGTLSPAGARLFSDQDQLGSAAESEQELTFKALLGEVEANGETFIEDVECINLLGDRHPTPRVSNGHVHLGHSFTVSGARGWISSGGQTELRYVDGRS